MFEVVPGWASFPDRDAEAPDYWKERDVFRI